MSCELKPIQEDTPEWEIFLAIVKQMFDDNEGIVFDPDVYKSAVPHQHFILLVDGGPAGACTLSLSTSTPGLKESGSITNFCVLPEYQKQGFGKRMSDALSDYAKRTHGITTLRLTTILETFNFYTAVGYVPDGPQELDSPYSPIFMKKEI